MTTHLKLLSEDFRTLFSQRPGAVSLITMMDGDRPVGFTATSVVSVSADPTLVLFTIMNSSSCYSSIQDDKQLSIHFLEAGHENLAYRFSQKGIDRFADTDWELSTYGTPTLSGVSHRIDGTVQQRIEAGGSTIVLCEVDRINTQPESSALLYSNRVFATLSK